MDDEVLGRFAHTCFVMHDLRVPSITSFVESFRPNQIACKKWLVEEILNYKMSWNKVLVIGSWNGVLLYELLNSYGEVTWFDFLDKDPDTHLHRDLYFNSNNLEKNYNSLIIDATGFSDYENYDLIINTSCEHMPNIPAVYGPTYALQSNNYKQVKEHINCVYSTKQLLKQNNICKVIYEGQKKLDHYTRYMVLGWFA